MVLIRAHPLFGPQGKHDDQKRERSKKLTSYHPFSLQNIMEFLFFQLWPVIAAVVTTYQSDDKIMERTCRCVRFILRCLGKYSYSILTSLVEIVRLSISYFSFLFFSFLVHHSSNLLCTVLFDTLFTHRTSYDAPLFNPVLTSLTSLPSLHI